MSESIEERRARYREYYHRNVEETRRKQNEYLKKRRKQDPEYAEKHNEYRRQYVKMKRETDPDYHEKVNAKAREYYQKRKAKKSETDVFKAYDPEKFVEMGAEEVLRLYTQMISKEELACIEEIVKIAESKKVTEKKHAEMEKLFKELEKEQKKRVKADMEDLAEDKRKPGEAEDPTDIATYTIVWKNGFFCKRNIQLNAVTGDWRYV